MPKIASDFHGQTVITTFETTPGLALDLIEALQTAYAECISKQPGFIAAGVHINDAHTRVCSYSQWQGRGDYQAMLRSTEMRERNRNINALCRGFEPVMYDIIANY